MTQCPQSSANATLSVTGVRQPGAFLTGEKYPSAVEDSSQTQQENSVNQSRSAQQPKKCVGNLRDVAKSCNLIGVAGFPAIGNKSMYGSSPGFFLPHAD